MNSKSCGSDVGCTDCDFGSNPTSNEEWQAQKDAVDPSV